MSSASKLARGLGSAALAAVGGVAALSALGFGVTRDDGQIGPGFLPLVLGALMVVLGAIDLATLARTRQPKTAAEITDIGRERREPPPDISSAPDVDTQGRSQMRRNWMLVSVAGMLVGAVLLVPVTGLLVALGLLMVAISVFVEKRKPLSALCISFLTVAATYLVFDVLLKVPLPNGLLGIL